MRSLVSPCASFVRRCNTTTVSRVSSLGISNGKHHSATYRNNHVEVHTTRVVGSTSKSTSSISTTFAPLPREIVQPLHPSAFSPIPQYPREIVFLVGAPGAGKGTHSLHIANQRHFTAPTIVVSDLLNTPACKLLKDHGIMVDDHFVFNVLLAELQKPIYRNGVVVDGFPRTATQATFLTDFYYATSFQNSPNIMLVMLHVEETLSIERQLERGRRLSLENQQLAAAGQPLRELRQTDLEYSAAKARYQVFEAQNEAITALSQTFPLVTVDASSKLHEVRTNLSAKLVSMF